MPISNYGLDTFVGHNLSKILDPTVKSVHGEFAGLDAWLASFVLANMLNLGLPQNQSALCFALLRRTQAALDDYDEACSSIKSVAQRNATISNYFLALRRFESVIALLYQTYNFAREALSIRLFEKGDGTPLQRLNSIYNRSRHPDLNSLPTGHLHPVWIEDDGIHTAEAVLLFKEIEDMLREVGGIADQLSKGQANASPCH